MACAFLGDVFLYLCLIEPSVKGDEMTRGQKEKVWWWLAPKKEEVKKKKKRLTFAKTVQLHGGRQAKPMEADFFCSTAAEPGDSEGDDEEGWAGNQ